MMELHSYGTIVIAVLTNFILAPFIRFDVFFYNFDKFISILAFLCVGYAKNMEHLVDCNLFPCFHIVFAWVLVHSQYHTIFVSPPHTSTRTKSGARTAFLCDFQAGIFTIPIRTSSPKSNRTRGTKSFLYSFEDSFHFTSHSSGSSSVEGVRYYRCTPSFFKLWPGCVITISAS